MVLLMYVGGDEDVLQEEGGGGWRRYRARTRGPWKYPIRLGADE